MTQPRLLQGPRREIGEDPDYRFTLANERTFLAWIRTGLAMIAGGLAATQLLPELAVPWGREAIGTALVGFGTTIAALSFRRWVRHEEAMRQGQPIPSSSLPAVLAVGVALLAIAALVILVVDNVLPR